MLVEHTEKEKRVRSLIDMPLYLSKLEPNSDAVKLLLEKDKGLHEPVIIIPHIGFSSVIEIDGFRMYLTGRTGTNLVYAPALQLVIGYENERYVRKTLKYCVRAAEYLAYHKGELPQINRFDGISNEQNLALYDLFQRKVKDTPYCIRLSAQSKNLSKARTEFEGLSLEEQCLVLKQILNLFVCNRATADLKKISLGGQVGVISTSRCMTNYQSAKLISQSVSGLFERSRDLLA